VKTAGAPVKKCIVAKKKGAMTEFVRKVKEIKQNCAQTSRGVNLLYTELEKYIGAARETAEARQAARCARRAESKTGVVASPKVKVVRKSKKQSPTTTVAAGV